MSTETQTPNLRLAVWALAWPAMTEMMLHMVVGLADTAMVGRLGPESIAAVGLAQQIFMLGTVLFAAIGTGSTSLTARHIGANEPQAAGEIARQSLMMGLFIAGSVTVVLLFTGRQILGILFRHADAEVLSLSASYVYIASFGLVFHFILVLINSVLRGAGDTKTPLRLTGIVNVANILGNYLLIFGAGPIPAFGIAGAAASTAFCQSLGGILALRILLRSNRLQMNLEQSFRFNWTVIRRILRIGIPASLEQMAMRLGHLFFTMIVASLGTVAYAAHQVALYAESISFMPGFGFSLAAVTLVGQNLGAENPQRAEASGYITNQMAMIIMSTMGVIFFLFPEQLIALFTPDPEVIGLAATCLRIIAVIQPALATLMVLSGGLRGAGDTGAILKITAFGFFAVRILLAYVLAILLELGLIGAWIAMGTDLLTRGLLIRHRYRQGAWKYLKV